MIPSQFSDFGEHKKTMAFQNNVQVRLEKCIMTVFAYAVEYLLFS